MTFELFGQEFGIFYIISQVFALLTIIFNLIAIQQRKKTRLLNIDTIAAFCSLGHYVFLGA
ncbi:MAG: YgjV family protein, partial [Elusimicrobiaceae bacterium]|nr:YgjV family protein [Elusimicrobiaceae bacterium]